MTRANPDRLPVKKSKIYFQETNQSIDQSINQSIDQWAYRIRIADCIAESSSISTRITDAIDFFCKVDNEEIMLVPSYRVTKRKCKGTKLAELILLSPLRESSPEVLSPRWQDRGFGKKY